MESKHAKARKSCVYAWINEPGGLWSVQLRLVMNSLRKRGRGNFREWINELPLVASCHG
jgi:hypothetical protein